MNIIPIRPQIMIAAMVHSTMPRWMSFARIASMSRSAVSSAVSSGSSVLKDTSRARSITLARRCVSIDRKVPMLVNKNAGASTNWMTREMSVK